MTSEKRLLKIEEIYHACLELPPEKRSSFLTRVCEDDLNLKGEVESLISYAEKESSLIDNPPVDVAAEIFLKKEHLDIIGKEIEQYKIISHLGSGGMGEVFLARDSKLERLAAVKFIKPEIAQMPEQLNRFLQEAKTASALNHPNIITVYEIGETRETQFITTEYIEGKTLRKIMGENSLSLAETLEIISQVATAIGAAHQAGIIHRDIKPENIMLREDKLVKVLDFGLAKFGGREVVKKNEVEKNNLNLNSQSLTQTGLMMGTLTYMSPEQARLEPIDKRSDIWSLGVLLYEMCSGTKPFKGETPEEKIESILKKEPLPLSKDFPFELTQIIKKALQKDTAKRYQTAGEFLQDIINLGIIYAGEGKILSRVFSSGKEHLTSPDESRVSSPTNLPTDHNPNQQRKNISTAEFVFSGVKKRKAVSGVVVVAFLFALITGGYLYSLADPQTENSIAVLPFVNESEDTELDYLSDGLSESIIDLLSQISNIKVIAKNSSFQFKEKKDIQLEEIADKLTVNYILRGRIKKHRNGFRVFAELINAKSKKKIWGERFERNLTEVINLETEISRKIADQIEIPLTNKGEKQLVKVQKVKPEAYKLLLKGHFYKSIGEITNSKKAIEQYNKALHIDPNYVLAYAALADTYRYMGVNSFLDPKEAFPRAKEAAGKALELNDNIAEVHSTLGNIYRDEWKWGEAEKEYKRALELNPNLASTYFQYSFFLSSQGRHQQAISYGKKGRELDPLKRNIYSDIGYLYYFARQYDLAKEQFEIGLELNPDYSGTIYGLGFVNFQLGNYSEALANFQRTQNLLGGKHTGVKCYFGLTLAKTGKTGDARRILFGLENGKDYVSPVELAVLYLGLGEGKKALASLEKGYEEKDAQMSFLGVEPHFDSIRTEPRFIELMKKVGLSPENYQ